MNTKHEIKPPPGVMPTQIWLEQRAYDLAQAILNYIAVDRFEEPKKWVEELSEILTSPNFIPTGKCDYHWHLLPMHDKTSRCPKCGSDKQEQE